MTTNEHPAAAPEIDPVMQERLARLAARQQPKGALPAPSAPTTAPAGRPRKRHAAKGSRAAAVVMSVTIAAGLSAYFQHVDSSSSSATTLSVTSATTGTTAAATGATTAAAGSAASTATTATAATTATSLADGTYAGASNTNRWGVVQVQITVSGGTITQVTALKTPTGGKSDSINASATPILASEAVSAQSAKIDTVSGATYTSTSYKISLQSAIDQAQAAAAKAGASA